MPLLSAAEWKGIRVLYEEYLVPPADIASVANVHERTVRRHAANEGWKQLRLPKRAGGKGSLAQSSPDELGADGELAELPEGMSLEDVRQRFADVLPRLLGKIIALAERGVLDKARIDALISMGRILERSEAFAEERAEDKQKRSDDELAAMLERIDDRIIELAQAHAEGLGSGEYRDGSG